MNPESMEGSKTSRGHFLRRLGVTLAAGIGVAMYGASVARANDFCCKNQDCDAVCGFPNDGYACNDSCTGNVCCVCTTGQPHCFQSSCPCP